MSHHHHLTLYDLHSDVLGRIIDKIPLVYLPVLLTVKGLPKKIIEIINNRFVVGQLDRIRGQLPMWAAMTGNLRLLRWCHENDYKFRDEVITKLLERRNGYISEQDAVDTMRWLYNTVKMPIKSIHYIYAKDLPDVLDYLIYETPLLEDSEDIYDAIGKMKSKTIIEMYRKYGAPANNSFSLNNLINKERMDIFKELHDSGVSLQSVANNIIFCICAYMPEHLELAKWLYEHYKDHIKISFHPKVTNREMLEWAYSLGIRFRDIDYRCADNDSTRMLMVRYFEEKDGPITFSSSQFARFIEYRNGELSIEFLEFMMERIMDG
jgi:hypothetical protein